MLTLEERKLIGYRIKEARKNNGLTQKQCAKKLDGITVQMISGWETGNVVPQLDNLIKISKLFNLSLDYLITGVAQENKNMEINTYKDVFRHMIALEAAGIFDFNVIDSGLGNIKEVVGYTFDEKIIKYVNELQTLKNAAGILDQEMLTQATKKLLEKYDIPLARRK